MDHFVYLLNLVIALKVFGDEEFFSACCFGDKQLTKACFIDEVCASESEDCETYAKL